MREREEKINGTPAWKISFREIARPTVLQVAGLDVPTSGAAWVRPGDGVVLRTVRTARTRTTPTTGDSRPQAASFRNERTPASTTPASLSPPSRPPRPFA